jgi:hypothetical protein
MNSKFQQNMWFVIFMLCLLTSIYVYLVQQRADKDLIPMGLATIFAAWRFYSIRKKRISN